MSSSRLILCEVEGWFWSGESRAGEGERGGRKAGEMPRLRRGSRIRGLFD